MSVLIIDGDQQFAESTLEALAAQGITAHVVAEASLDTVKSLRPRVLMLSVELPRGSGFAICSRVRRDPGLKATPIFLTSSSQTEGALERHAAGPDRADDYALKPIDPSEVVARIGRLLENAPEVEEGEEPPAPAESAGPPPLKRSTDDVSPPPLTRSTAPDGGPPPLPGGPPPLNKTIDTPAPDTIDVSEMSSRDIALRRTDEGRPRPSTGGTDDLWVRSRFEDVLRQVPVEPDVDTRTRGRPTPEDRMNQLRGLVRQHEARERHLREEWNQLEQRGLQMARRVSGLTNQIDSQATQLAELEKVKTDAEESKSAIESEFRAFQEEITRIFQEKDSEEQQRLGHYESLEVDRAEMQARITGYEEQKVDDERRLQIMQEELETLTNEKDAADEQLGGLAADLMQRDARVEELEARLQTTETVAAERAEENERLNEQIDTLALDKDRIAREASEASESAVNQLTEQHETEQSALNERLSQAKQSHQDELERLKQEHSGERETAQQTYLEEMTQLREDLEQRRDALSTQVAGLEAELDSTTERLNQEHEEATAAARERQQDLLGALSQTHETEIAELTEQRNSAETEVGDLAASVAQLQAELQTERSERAEESEVLGSELRERSARLMEVEQAFEKAQTAKTDLEREQDELEAELEQVSEALREAKTRISTLDEQRIASQDAHEQSQVRLQQVIEQTRADATASRSQLEDEIVRLHEESKAQSANAAAWKEQAEQFDLEVEGLRAQVATLTPALEAAEVSVQEEQALKAAVEAEQEQLRSTVEQLDLRRVNLEGDVEDLSERLQTESHKGQEAQSALGRAQEELKSALQRAHQAEEREEELREAVAQAQSGQGELDAAVQAERARADEYKARSSEFEQRWQRAQTRLEGETASRNEMERHAADQATQMHALESRLADADVQAAKLLDFEAEVLAQGTELEVRQTALLEQNAEIDRLQVELAARADETDGAQERVRRVLEDAQAETRKKTQKLQELQAELQKTQKAHRAELAQLNKRIEAQRRTKADPGELQNLRRSERRLKRQVTRLEEKMAEWRFSQETIRSTLQSIESDLERESGFKKGHTATYNLFLNKVSRAVSMSLDTMANDEEEDLSQDVEAPNFVIYTGEVEPLDPGEERGTDVGPFGLPDGGDEPFADLVAELKEAAESDGGLRGGGSLGFDESFAGESTRTDYEPLAGAAGTPEDADEDERDVTEIIDLQNLE